MKHSAGSLLAGCGVPIQVISKRLGHRSPAFTLARYVHLLEGQQAEAGDRIEEALRGAMG
jgi:integrase